MSKGKRRLIAASYHRNGIWGQNFTAALIEKGKGPDARFLVIDFGGESLAVLNLFELGRGDVGQDGNKWRFENFADEVRALLRGVDLHAQRPPATTGEDAKAAELAD